jgi:peroxiredoxin Q/BCP
MLAEGDTMPSVRVTDDAGNDVDTKSLLGKPLVLWFYPKDDTPG